MIKYKHRFNEEDAKKILQLQNDESNSINFVYIFICAILFIGSFAFAVLSLINYYISLFFILILFIIGLLINLGYYIWSNTSLKKHELSEIFYSSSRYNLLKHEDFLYDFADNGISCICNAYTAFYSWAAIIKIKKIDTYICLKMADNQYLLIDQSELSKNDRTELERFIENHFSKNQTKNNSDLILQIKDFSDNGIQYFAKADPEEISVRSQVFKEKDSVNTILSNRKQHLLYRFILTNILVLLIIVFGIPYIMEMLNSSFSDTIQRIAFLMIVLILLEYLLANRIRNYINSETRKSVVLFYSNNAIQEYYFYKEGVYVLYKSCYIYYKWNSFNEYETINNIIYIKGIIEIFINCKNIPDIEAKKILSLLQNNLGR